MSHSQTRIILLSSIIILFVSGVASTVHAAPNYNLTLSTSRIQETNSPGVTLTLNVSNAVPGTIYGFTWNVTDPSGRISSFLSGGSANGGGVLTLTSVYPRDFSGASINYNGTYGVKVFQFTPTIPTPLVATGKFYAGLTDSLSYQRTMQVSVLAQGYTANENLTIRISHLGIPVSSFPRFQLANANGVIAYSWRIPASTPLGNYNVTLTGQTTVKKPPDSQLFNILPTSVSILRLAANITQSQGSKIVVFSFTASYPDGSPAQTGATTIRVVEPEGTTTHLVNALYNTTFNGFMVTYQIASAGPSGAWAATIDAATFDDGYGNVGPSSGVARGFDVQGPTTSQNPPSSTVSNLLLVIVILLAVALTVLVSWVLYMGRKRIQRNVLKVDFDSIEKEAKRVESRELFVKIQDQLKQRHQTRPEEETKDG